MKKNRKNTITFYVSKEEKELIKKAGEIIALDFSGFCRSSSIEKATKILSKKLNKESSIE